MKNDYMNTFHTSESESLLPEFWSVSLVKFWNVFHLAKVVWLSASDEGFDIFCFLQLAPTLTCILSGAEWACKVVWSQRNSG